MAAHLFHLFRIREGGRGDGGGLAFHYRLNVGEMEIAHWSKNVRISGRHDQNRCHGSNLEKKLCIPFRLALIGHTLRDNVVDWRIPLENRATSTIYSCLRNAEYRLGPTGSYIH